jgi:hypothetical protein
MRPAFKAQFQTRMQIQEFKACVHVLKEYGTLTVNTTFKTIQRQCLNIQAAVE